MCIGVCKGISKASPTESWLGLGSGLGLGLGLELGLGSGVE